MNNQKLSFHGILGEVREKVKNVEFGVDSAWITSLGVSWWLKGGRAVGLEGRKQDSVIDNINCEGIRLMRGVFLDFW